MNLRIVFKFKDGKLQFYEKRRLFCYFRVNPCMPASRWRRLLKLKQKKNYFKIIIGFLVTPPLFLATKVVISFVYCSPNTIKSTQKPKIEKKFTGLDQSSEWASECHSPHHIYNSLLRMRAIHELKRADPAETISLFIAILSIIINFKSFTTFPLYLPILITQIAL